MTSVADVMSRNPVTASRDASLQEIVSLMTKKSVGSVIITDGDLPLGVVTERELLWELAGHGRIRKEVKAGQVMVSSIAQVEPTASVEEAARTMIARKARLVVTSGGRLVGVVTASDLVKAFAKGEKDAAIEQVISPKVRTLDAAKTIKEAIELMHERRIGSVVVTKKDKPLGIFTERDLLTKVLKVEGRLSDGLEKVASRPLTTAEYGLSAKKVASLMQSRGIKRLPLTREGELVGMVTARDLVEAFSKA